MADDAQSSRVSFGAPAARVLLFLVLALAACAPDYAGGRSDGRAEVWFDADVLSGIGEGGRPRATVTVTIPRRNLVYFKHESGFVSRYRVRAVQRVDGRALRMQEWSGEAHAETFEQTRQPEVERRTVAVELLEFATDPERFALEVQVEIEGTQRRASRTVAVEPRRYEMGGLALGELALYRSRGRNVTSEQGLVELGAALPDGHQFGRQENRSFDLATGEPWLLVRIFDLRAAPSTDPYSITVRTTSRSSTDPRWTEIFAAAPAGGETALLVRLPAHALSFGENRVRVSLPGTDGVEIAVENLGLDLGDERSWAANLEQIEVLGTNDELRHLREAESGQRLDRWEEFWRRRDPEPSTPQNERLEDHYRRVAHARSYLQDGFRDGALSDRGRIWILHGRPDSVDSSAPGFQSYATYEVWSYRSLGLTYYFQDSDGFGAFRLVWREVS